MPIDKAAAKITGTKPAAAAAPVPAPAEPRLTGEAKILAITLAEGKAFEGWSAKMKKAYQGCVQLVEEIELKGIDLTTNIDDWADAAMGLAFFGEDGRPLFYRLAKVKSLWPEYQHRMEFDAALVECKSKSASKFTDLAKHFGVSLQQIRKDEIQPAKTHADLVEELRHKHPDGVNVSDYIEYGFYEYKNCYFFQEGERDIKQSNFTMTVKFLVKSKTNPKRIVELRNIYGSKTLVDMSTDTLVSVGKFNVATQSEGNYLFEGKEQHLNRVKRKLFNEERASTEIETLGWQPEAKIYAFANGIFNGRFSEVDEFGVVEHNEKHYFIPMFSKIYQYDNFMYENERKFVYKRSELDFEQWSKLFHQVYGDNALIGISFLVAALFRDIVYKRFRFFPILNLFGEPGSGKSTMAISLMALFGEGQEPYMLSGAGTPKAFMRKFAQYRNALVWLDEYRNNIENAKIESLKNIYDGTGYERAMMSQDNRTKTTPVHSACILSGQELPTVTPALFKRVVLLKFRHQPWNLDNFNSLVSHQTKGLTSVVTEILKLRDSIDGKFDLVFDECLKEIREAVGGDVEDRILKNSVVLLAIHKLLQKELKYPYSYNQLRDHMAASIKEQNKLISTSQEIRKFWDVVEFLLETKQIEEDVDFKFVDDHLVIRLNRIHPLYLESHQRQYGQRGLDKTSLNHYLEADRAFIDTVKSTRFKNTNTSAMRFNYKLLGVNLATVNGGDYEVNKDSNYQEMPEEDGMIRVGKLDMVKTPPVDLSPSPEPGF